MPWKITFDEQTRVVETTYTGAIGPAELGEVALATIAAGRAHAAKLYLGDCLTLKHAVTLFNIYDLINFYDSLSLERDMREAILLPLAPAAGDALKFYETTAKNRGYNVRVFNNRAEALVWLLENQASASSTEGRTPSVVEA